MNFPTMAQLNYIDLFKLLDCSLQILFQSLFHLKTMIMTTAITIKP